MIHTIFIKTRARRITAADSTHEEKHNCLQYILMNKKSFVGKDGYPHGLPSSGEFLEKRFN